MATKPYNGAANGTVAAPKSDLASLWEQAINDYEQRTGKSLKMMPVQSMSDVIQDTETEVKKFKGFRHQDTKTDKVRTAFKNNLWLIQKVVNTIQIVGSTAAAFPPAMPAALIFNAFGQVMTSFDQMSADYDKVVGFFEFTQRFLDRLSMIEGKSPPMAPFQRCIMRVFSSMLTICAVAQSYATEHGRFKKWFSTLMEGSDPGLAGAYKDMESAINEMSEAVKLATLNTVLVLAEIVKSMEEGVEFIITKTTFIDERTKVIESKVDIVINQGQVIDSKADAMLQQQKEMNSLMKKIYDREHTKAGHEKTQDAKSRPGLKTKTDPGENKRVALTQVASKFSDFSPRWSSLHKDTKAQRNEIRSDSVPGTGKWLFEEKALRSWAEQEEPIVWMRGNAGIGKSFLAEAVITSLETSQNDRKSFGYFFFREEEDNLRHFTEALYCMSYQLAEADPKYCEQLASELSKTDSAPSDPWELLFADRFPSKGEDHAYLILDGIDEIKEEELKGMVKCLEKITQESLNIHVLLTSRPAISEEMETLKPSILEVSKKQLTTDIDKVIAANLKRLPRLKKFRKSIRTYILNKVRAKADGMRYVDHMLRRLSVIGREKAVLKDLDRNLPGSLEELYEVMLKDCQANRTEKQYLTLKRLFAWLAYSKRALTLDEAGELIARTVDDDKTFDIEDEIIGRSARILEIVRSRDGEDEDDEDAKADDSDQANDTVEVDLQDSGQTPLAFQERSLREYFQAVDVDEKGLRTPPSAAHLTIFEMATDLLFKADNSHKDDDQPKLLSYAADFWAQHFVEIDLSKATDDEVKRVVNILHKLLNNHNNVSRTFEHFAGYSYSGMGSESGASWLKTIKEWAGRATSSDLLTLEVNTWAKEIGSSDELLMVLAYGHVINWYNQFNGGRISSAFMFARDAFNLSNIDVSADTLDSVLKVADYFTDIEKTAGSMRAISATLAELERTEDSIKYASQGLEMLETGNSSLRFYLTRSVSMSHGSLGRHEEAIQEVDKAIEALPPNWKNDKELVDIVEWIYEEQAGYLQLLDRPDDAIKAYDSFKSVRPDITTNGYFLDDMARIWSEARDPDGSKLLGLLHDWSEKERLAWFGYIFEYHDPYAIGRFDQAAAQNGEDGKKFLLECYDHYMATIPSTSDKIIFAQVALANTYRTVVRDPQKAKELYLAVLKHDIKDVDIRGSVDGTLFQVRRALAEILFEEFYQSTDPATKEKLLDEMKNFPDRRTEVHDFFQLQGSNISVMVALMTRVVGQATEFQSIMQKTFDTCVEGLSDSVGWNDSSSFRLLAKVLACMEGLERDALIALSCQFSKVTEEPETEGETEAVKEEAPPTDVIATDENTHINGDNESKEEVVEAEKEDEHPDAPIHITETTISSTTIEDGVLRESSTTIIEQASVEAAHEPDAVNTEEKPAEEANTQTSDPYADEETVPPILDEELGFGGLSCDGECGRSWNNWEVPIYFCLLCTNSDLCPTCYGKRMAQNRGEPATYWRPYCGENHRYAKGPIKGWKGVKGGLIRIEGGDGDLEEIKVQDWLKELKEVRWVKAWESFWKRLEGVNDLGF